MSDQDGKNTKRIEEMSLDEQLWYLQHPGEPYLPESMRRESVTEDLSKAPSDVQKTVIDPVYESVPIANSDTVYDIPTVSGSESVYEKGSAEDQNAVYVAPSLATDDKAAGEASAASGQTLYASPEYGVSPSVTMETAASESLYETQNLERPDYAGAGATVQEQIPGTDASSQNVQPPEGGQTPNRQSTAPLPGGYDPTPEVVMEKGNKTPVLILTGVLFLALIGVSIYLAIFASKKFLIAEKSDKQYTSDSEDPWADILGGDDKKDADQGKDKKSDQKKEDKKKEQAPEKPQKPQKPETDSSEQEDGAFFSDNDVATEEDAKRYQNHSMSEYEGQEYFEEFEDCIDESLAYKVNRKYSKRRDPEKGVDINTSYVQLEGNIPNLEKINEKLKEYGEIYIQYYEDNKDQIDEFLDYYQDTVCTVDTSCFVTYTDEDMISIIFEDKMDLLGDRGFNMTSVNLNIKTGTILDNSEILDLPDDFGAFFRERSIKQNGEAPGTSQLTDEQILALLKNPDTMIVFYTPVGLEVGFEYQVQGSSGWLTISLRDYQKYLKGM